MGNKTSTIYCEKSTVCKRFGQPTIVLTPSFNKSVVNYVYPPSQGLQELAFNSIPIKIATPFLTFTIPSSSGQPVPIDGTMKNVPNITSGTPVFDIQYTVQSSVGNVVTTPKSTRGISELQVPSGSTVIFSVIQNEDNGGGGFAFAIPAPQTWTPNKKIWYCSDNSLPVAPTNGTLAKEC